ncbi:MAG: hypothetical protein AAGI17_01880 [Planctomycetota bacterium]
MPGDLVLRLNVYRCADQSSSRVQASGNTTASQINAALGSGSRFVINRTHSFSWFFNEATGGVQFVGYEGEATTTHHLVHWSREAQYNSGAGRWENKSGSQRLPTQQQIRDALGDQNAFITQTSGDFDAPDDADPMDPDPYFRGLYLVKQTVQSGTETIDNTNPDGSSGGTQVLERLDVDNEATMSLSDVSGLPRLQLEFSGRIGPSFTPLNDASGWGRPLVGGGTNINQGSRFGPIISSPGIGSVCFSDSTSQVSDLGNNRIFTVSRTGSANYTAGLTQGGMSISTSSLEDDTGGDFNDPSRATTTLASSVDFSVVSGTSPIVKMPQYVDHPTDPVTLIPTTVVAEPESVGTPI